MGGKSSKKKQPVKKVTSSLSSEGGGFPLAPRNKKCTNPKYGIFDEKD